MVVYPDDQSSDFSFYKPYSDETAEKIDEKVRKYLEEAYDIAKNTILKHKKTIEKIAELLIKKEYISGEDFSIMVDNPEKIEELKNSDEITIKSENEEKEKSKIRRSTDKKERKLENKWKLKKDESKKSAKKSISHKKD